MSLPAFRVRRYAHPKYQFVVRAKVDGKWKRRYFTTEAEAAAFAQEQNRSPAEVPPNEVVPVKDFASPLQFVHPEKPSPTRADLVQRISSEYRGPQIERYFGNHWSMHLPFAYELMREFRPRVFVELGVWKGESYFTFCQSALENNVAVKCFGIDSWRGDVHMGKLDEALRMEVERYNNSKYAEFSELKAKTFEEAVGDFADESIDLLHIDGTHIYEDVRHDFESWLPKLSPTGVVLFHDVTVHGGGFGVWKLWQEIAAKGNSFVFEFGYGLGVWRRSPLPEDDRSFLSELFRATEGERQLINRHYATAASALALWESEKATELSLDRANEQARAASEEVEAHKQKISRLERAVEESRAQAQQILTQLNEAHAQERTQLKTSAKELDARRSEILTLEARIAVLTRDNLDVASQLEAERRHGAEQTRHRAGQTRELSERIKVAATEAEATNKALEISRAEARRLLASSQFWKARVEGARVYEAQRTQQLKTVAADLTQTASALRSNEENSSSIFDLISANIERIRHPSFWWKVMELLGFLRLMPPGAPRTTAERRAIAVELKAGFREIDEALSSKRLAPEEAASHIRRLFELRHRANAIVLSLRLPKILSGKSHPWTFIPWTRRTLPVVSRDSPAAILFDAPWYLSEYPEIAAAGLDPLPHYLKWGVGEQRNPNPLFNTAWYRARNPDVAAEGVNPLEHYVLRGAAEGRDPSPLFSTSWYLKGNPDVVEAGVNPLQHYLEHGIREGRNPHPLFETAYYLAQAPEAEGANPVEHYLKGGGWDVSPHPLFDTKWYFEQNPDVAAGKVIPLLHYLDAGAREGRDPHPLFDSSWYLDINPDVRANDINPLVHYLAAGSEEGRDPHPLFDVSWYRTRYFAHLAPGYDPLSHYLKKGWRDNLDPHPLFDTSRYLAENGDVAAHGVNPLVHFQIGGGIEGRDPHPLFDSSWYLESNPEVREERMNPLSHYLAVGAKRGRDPHPLFQTKYYYEQRRAHEFRAGELSETPLRSSTRKGSSKTKSQKGVSYAFTSICLNYVPKAIVLARTLKKYNPDIRFCVLVSDRIPKGALDGIDVFDEVITIEELDIANKPSWIFRHTVVELCTAVKGYFIVDLLEREDCAAAFYFDPDIVCFSPLDVLKEKLARASILLTPHLTDPEVTDEAIRDNEICALKHGVYNLGFLGLRPSPEGHRFARWWRDRLRDFCRADIPGGLFTDQRWVDLAPALFRELEIVRHPGCNAATWNLTNRHIEGDFTTGFTVNGEPLIFYHFSGFDSGAQGAMLDKYGGEMPSAQLLRKWYEEETTQSGEARFNQFPWTLGSFSNGEPISDAQRILYRDRQDLQNAFPNPFDASTSGHSYYHWYHSEVLGKPIDSTGANYNPLVEFVEESAPLSPNPFFDCNWYLQRNPDVVAAGVNPLVHFVLAGANEGRPPNPNFFPAYYREQLRPDERSENPLAHYILHGQKEGRRTDPRFHSTIDAPLRNRIRRWAKSGRPLILLVSHYGGGGTEKHLRDLTDSVQGEAKFLQLTPGHDGLVRLFPRSPDFSSKLVFDPAQQFDVLIEVIQEFEPQRIHIHHILGNEEYLAALVDRLKLPFDFTIHDYYVLAPSPHLVGGDGRFVGDDLEAHETELLAGSIARRRPTSLAAWQDAHNWLVTEADRVIVPSRDVARRVSRFFPAVRPIVSAHPEAGKAARKVTFPSLTPADTFRVAMLGDFLRHKGKDTFLECAKIVRSRADKISFELIGDAYNDSQLLREAGVWVSGRYEEGDALALLAQRQPHLLWYPAICPESYSYTLSVGLESGIPLAVTHLGSLPERVAGRPWAWVCPWEYTAADWIRFFRRIREKNFLPRIAPTNPAGINPVTSSFYSADYLAVLPGHRTCKEPDTESQLALTR
jgi:glycosyltransferase involved in cell wall biosynthesis